MEQIYHNMAYDKNYYEQKRREIEQKFQANPRATVNKVIQIMQEFLDTDKELKERYAELLEREKESKKEEKPKKK